MKIVLKPAGIVVIVLLIVVALSWILLSQGTGTERPASMAAANSAGSAVATPAGQPFTLVTPGFVLANPYFESGYRTAHAYGTGATVSGSVADPWYDDSGWANIAVDYAQDGSNPHDGASSQRIRVSNVKSGACQFVQTVNLTPGKVYDGGFWLRSDHPVSVDVMLRQAAYPIKTYATNTVKLTTKWQKVTAVGTIGSDPVSYLMLRINGPATVWVDDAFLEAHN